MIALILANSAGRTLGAIHNLLSKGFGYDIYTLIHLIKEMNRKHCSALAKFRAGVAPIRRETD